MVIRASYPYAQFDPDDDYATDQQWRMVTYNWTDQNHDGRLWRDKDHDGTVDNTPSDVTDIDGRPDPGLRQVRDRARRVRAVHVHQPVDQRLHEHDPLPSPTDQERPVRRLLPQPGLAGDPEDDVPLRDRVLQEHRLEVGAHPQDREGLVHGQHLRAEEHPVRSVRRRGRRVRARPEVHRPGSGHRRRDREAGREWSAHRLVDIRRQRG